MAGRIPSSFIDEILARADIVDIIDSRVQLKKTGREFQACCPFHNEKTPSFTVSPDKQFFHCFGCGAHGSALGFLMDYEHLGFVEAVEEIAAGVGMEVPREAGQVSHENSFQDLYSVMEKAANYYRQQLKHNDQAADYLKGRGLTGEIAAHFELGFAPPGWDNLGAALLSQGVSQSQLLQAGLVVKKDSGGYYDRFRDRIMFPIRDQRGRVIAFGGRQLGGDDGPKYLNSSETPIFHKGRELYGLYQARKAERKLERLLVVEGYMDVVALAQFGVRNVVATLGTATTRDHLERIFRIVPQIVFCFDGDRAGRQAAWRALENALPVLNEGRQIKFMFLPDGEDPDTLVRQLGEEGFNEQVAAASSFSDYLFGELAAKADMTSIDGRAQFFSEAKPLLAKLPEGVFRHMMATRLGEIAHIDDAALSELTLGTTTARRSRAQSTPKRGSSPSAVRLAIQMLLNRPTLVSLVEEGTDLNNLDLPGLPLFRQLLELLQQNPNLNCGAIIEHWRQLDGGQDSARHLAKLASQTLMVPNEGLEAEFRDVMTKLLAQQNEQLVDGLLTKARLNELTEQEKQQLKEALASRPEMANSKQE